VFIEECVPTLQKYIINIPGNSVERFIADFAIAASHMDRRTKDLSMVNINGFIASYATVIGDGACLFHAFLTALAHQLVGVVLPFDTSTMEIHGWILRLKLLMCDHILENKGEDFIEVLRTIPENGTVNTLDDYFKKFLEPTYHGTNFDIEILSKMFGKPIHVIREEPTDWETHQSFLKGQILSTEAGHINILFQPGHYVPIITIYDCSLRPADFLLDV